MSELLQSIIIAIITAFCTGVVFYGVNVLLDRRRGKTSIESVLATFIERVDNLIQEVRELKKDFKQHEHTQEGRVLVNSNSPLHLTDDGEEYFKNSGCKAYFEKHLQEWMKHFEGLNKDYLIHDKAREFMNDHYKQSTDADFKSIKAYMFYEGVSHEQIMLMLSVGLRDMVCEEKEIIIKKKEQRVLK